MADLFRTFPPQAGGDVRWVAKNPAGAILRGGFFGAPSGGGGGGGPGPLTFGGYQWGGSVSAASYTWTGLAIGAAASDRWVIAAIQTNNNSSQYLATVTIGGQAATLLYSAPAAGTTRVRFEFWAANVPAGTTADVAMTTDGGAMWDGACATYYCAGQPTFYAGAHDATYTGTTFSVAIDVPEGGAVIAQASNDGSGVLSAWAGVSVDDSDNTEQVYHASEDQLATQTGRTVSFTSTEVSTSANFFGMAVLSVSVPSVGGGAQTLNPPLVSEADFFGTATVTLGPVTLTPPLVSEADFFGVAAVTLGPVDLTPPLVSEADFFGAATVTPGPVTLNPPLVSEVDFFGAATVSLGSGGTQNLTPPLITQTDFFGAATVTLGAVTLTPPLVTEADFFGAAAVAPEPVTLTPPLVTEADFFGAATVSLGGGVTQSLTPPLVTQADYFGAATVTLGSVLLTPPLVSDADFFGAATVTLGPVMLTPPLVSDADFFGVAIVSLGPVVLTPPLVSEADFFGVATVTLGPVTLTPPLLTEVDFFGAAVLIQVAPNDYSTGRLAFATEEPRRGEILNDAVRKGTVLNTAPRKGETLNQATREGDILNPVRRGRIEELDP